MRTEDWGKVESLAAKMRRDPAPARWRLGARNRAFYRRGAEPYVAKAL